MLREMPASFASEVSAFIAILLASFLRVEMPFYFPAKNESAIEIYLECLLMASKNSV